MRRQCRILLQLSLILIHYVQTSLSSSSHNTRFGVDISEARHYASSPSINMQPADIAPIPMVPFTYDSVPKLSGLCGFNFSSAESILKVTAADCWSLLAPYLANAVCCPQFEATLLILMGQYYYNLKNKNIITTTVMNETQANHCISDVEKILEINGAAENLHKICSINSTILVDHRASSSSSSSCPVSNLNEINWVLEENTSSSSVLLDSCNKIDENTECCTRVCQNALSTAAEKLALRKGTELVAEINVNDCKKIVLTWLASRLEPSTANKVLRVLSNCNNNKACPLMFPDIKNVSKECGNSSVNSQTSCCHTLKNYMSQLKEQTFITNIQALNCAANLGVKLQNQNVSTNIYNLCHTKLKDFSLQVDPKESGCLLPNLPSDVTFDKSSGIGFICDLNDNVEAPWPFSGSVVPDYYSCNKTNTLPELPKPTSYHRGMHNIGFLSTFATLFTVVIMHNVF